MQRTEIAPSIALVLLLTVSEVRDKLIIQAQAQVELLNLALTVKVYI